MHEPDTFRIAPAATANDLAAVAELFRDYAASLEVDLTYQNFAAELASLPGQYAPPAGALLLTRDADGAAVGCVALRPMELAGCCEMKRLYVCGRARGTGLGRKLAVAIIREAVRIGYREVRLDSLPTMLAAVALYRTLGFEPTAAYYDTPVAGTVFMRRTLR